MAHINRGKKWDNNEETLLLDEISKNIPLDSIAVNHGRTKGAIVLHLQEMAYKMHLFGVSFDDIISKTGLDKTQIDKIIENNGLTGDKLQKHLVEEDRKKLNELVTEVKSIKNDLSEIKSLLRSVVLTD